MSNLHAWPTAIYPQPIGEDHPEWKEKTNEITWSKYPALDCTCTIEYIRADLVAAPYLLAAAMQAVLMMERAKKLLMEAGFTMDNGTISKPYTRALIDLQAAIAHATGDQP